MKKILRLLTEKFLQALVRIKLRRTHPTVIGITGSFGKTSTKEAIYAVMKTKWRVYRSEKSLNTEIGLLLAALEQESGFSSPLKWAAILFFAVANAFFSRAYDFLILEYGADKPGDIEHLVSIVPPNIAVITHIAAVHQAKGQFADAGAVFKEKQKLVTHLLKENDAPTSRRGSNCLASPPLGPKIAILNGDDRYLSRLTDLKAQTFFWHANGASNAILTASNIKNTRGGFEATLHQGGKKVHAQFQIAGAYHIDIILPALIVGLLHGISLEEGVSALRHFKLPPGRMSIIEGKNGAALLDGTYNASPETMKQALKLLRDFPGKRKIAVIGSMNELGEYGARAHGEIAEEMGDWLNMLITVGELAQETAVRALKHGFPKHRIVTFPVAEEAGNFLLEKGLNADDVILLKGSQNRIRLERAVKMLMAHPEKAGKLLCRQEKEWV